MSDMGAGFRPVKAADAYEAEQPVPQEYAGALTATLSLEVTDTVKIRQLFVDWQGKIWLDASGEV